MKKHEEKVQNKLIESVLTAIIMIALSKNPNPTNGTALWKATKEILNQDYMSRIWRNHTFRVITLIAS